MLPMTLSAQDIEADFRRCAANDRRPEIAIDACTRAIESDQLNNEALAIAFSNRGHKYSLTGQLDLAIDNFNRANRLKPDFPNNLSNRAHAYITKGEFDKAAADVDRAIGLDPEHYLARNNRCEIYYKTNQFDRAIADCSVAINIKPKFANPYVGRAWSYEQKGMRSEALRDYKMAYSLGQRTPWLINRLRILGVVFPKK
jgi:tetratricopeptide (TPR) repeat protein